MNVRKYSVVLYFILYFFSSIAFGQQPKELLFKVIDFENKYPVPYATIQFKNSDNGIIANVDGDFRIPYLYKEEKDILEISSIGFETKFIELVNVSDQGITTIYLKPKVELLDQVLITGTKKKQQDASMYTIIKRAIALIPQNYPMQPYSMISYYRDYQVVDKKYYNVNEAIIKSFDEGFATDIMMHKNNKSALLKYRENNEFSKDKSLLVPYDSDSKYIENTVLSGQGGNELGILKIHDPIRNYEQLSFSFVYVFKEKFLNNHELVNVKTVYLNDNQIYEISFKAKPNVTGTGHSGKGKIYIAKDDYKIYRFEYQVFEKGKENLENNFSKKNSLYEVILEYKPKGDKMYLSYITFNNNFTALESSFFDISNIDYKVEEQSFYVTFNSPLLESSVSKRDFKFKFDRKKLLIEEFNKIDSVTVKLKLAEWSVPDALKTDGETLNLALQSIDYNIKNVYDIRDRKIFDIAKISGHQFRELFVQQVDEGKQKLKSLQFIDPNKPLSDAEINLLPDLDKYWLNSTLKTIDN